MSEEVCECCGATFFRGGISASVRCDFCQDSVKWTSRGMELMHKHERCLPEIVFTSTGGKS